MKRLIPLILLFGCNGRSISNYTFGDTVIVQSVAIYEGISVLHRVEKLKFPSDKKYMVTTNFFEFQTDSLYNPGDTLVVLIKKSH